MAATSIYDYKLKRETLPILSMLLVFATLTIGNVEGFITTVLTISFSKLITFSCAVRISRKALYYVSSDIIPAFLILLLSIALSLVSNNVVFIGMDKWSSQVVFSTIPILLFSMVLEPSTKPFENMELLSRARF